MTNDFHALDDIGWYGSAYLLTMCSMQLIYGRIYTFYPPKLVFLASIFLFEIGSVVCGAAPTSTAFIVGRAIAGLGASGIISGVIIIIVYTVPLEKRPVFVSTMGAIFGITSVISPLLGGVITEKATWRWCFYINLPVGAVSTLIVIFFLTLEPPADRDAKASWKQQVIRLDPIGSILFLPGMVCLLLALQWGGTEYEWSNGRIIALLVVSGVLLILFAVVQHFMKDNATVPTHIISQRSVFAGAIYAGCIGGSMNPLLYYLSIYFQALKNASATKAGIMSLPLVLSLVVSSILAGATTQTIARGYYTQNLILGSVIASVGTGLITTFRPDTGHAQWIGYQFLYGFGCGLGMQQANLGAQTVLSRKDVSTGVSLMFFSQSFGGALFIAVAQNLFASKLVDGVAGIPGLNSEDVLNVGATALRSLVDPSQLNYLLIAYNAALRDAFRVALGVTAFSIVGALLMEWRSVKPRKENQEAKA
ncbi:major facilitator superfamily protein [Eremomyces bilateralis CBS 781.70]|uniref:Major facilitator superfamily protein n=1 Tax=Eremomyces bilateralis CBS 781.70 TaxID=1392243 RepID=A0A6G1GBK9_9PEZI|nr:major facilitator superfamily protein [Eremomyces bilateralis CBS 781.70]KAF1815326.1 major facilitator superfamily protein [Eremomyces bilateralis CBS 781.70]